MKELTSRDKVYVEQIRILLAEDHANFRKSLKTLIESDKDFEVVGEAKDGKQAVKLAGELQPDIVIMDIGMPLLNGLEATRQVMTRNPSTRVLILSSYSEPEYIKKAMEVGVSGYLIKQSSAPVLIEAIREVLGGKTYFSSSIPKRLRDGCQKAFDKRQLLK